MFPCLRTPQICRGSAAAADSQPYDQTLPVVVRVNNARHISPSRYSTAMCQSDQQGTSADRNRPASGLALRTLFNVDEQEAVRFVNASEDFDNNDDNQVNNYHSN